MCCRTLYIGKDWGTIHDGKWTGLVGRMVSGEADLAAASLDITLTRSEAVDFIWPMVGTSDVLVVTKAMR